MLFSDRKIIRKKISITITSFNIISKSRTSCLKVAALINVKCVRLDLVIAALL